MKCIKKLSLLIAIAVLVNGCAEKVNLAAKENHSCKLVILPPQGQSVFFVNRDAEDTIELIDEIEKELVNRCQCSLSVD